MTFRYSIYDFSNLLESLLSGTKFQKWKRRKAQFKTCSDNCIGHDSFVKVMALV